MDIATLIGIITGFTLVIGSILLDGSILAFVNVPGMMVVMGGTVAASLIAQPLKVCMNGFRVVPLS